MPRCHAPRHGWPYLTWLADGLGFVCWLIIAALAFLTAYALYS